jgi:DNA-binding NtrC family response regulator
MESTVLVVMAADRRRRLRPLLESCDLQVMEAAGCAQAVQILRTRPVQAVLTDQILGDGDWKTVAAEVRPPAAVILCIGVPDPMLWIDALEQGAYDVIVEPYELPEVKRIIGSALLQGRLQPQKDRRAASERYAATT